MPKEMFLFVTHVEALDRKDLSKSTDIFLGEIAKIKRLLFPDPLRPLKATALFLQGEGHLSGALAQEINSLCKMVLQVSFPTPTPEAPRLIRTCDREFPEKMLQEAPVLPRLYFNPHIGFAFTIW